MKVYALSTGEYSDYHVLGIYSTEENAGKAKKAYGEASIEEYEIDSYAPRVGFIRVDINRHFEATAYPIVLQPSQLELNKSGLPQYTEELGFQTFSVGGPNATMFWNVETDDKKTAIKVVSEKLRKILALGLWNDSAGVRRHKI